MKNSITLNTTVGEVLQILNEAVAPLAGQKFQGGYSEFHDMVAEAVAGIKLPRQLRFGAWHIRDTVGYIDIFEYSKDIYSKDIKEDARFKGSLVVRGKINKVVFSVVPQQQRYNSSSEVIPYDEAQPHWTIAELIANRRLFDKKQSLSNIRSHIVELQEEITQNEKWHDELNAEIVALMEQQPKPLNV